MKCKTKLSRELRCFIHSPLLLLLLLQQLLPRQRLLRRQHQKRLPYEQRLPQKSSRSSSPADENTEICCHCFSPGILKSATVGRQQSIARRRRRPALAGGRPQILTRRRYLQHSAGPPARPSDRPPAIRPSARLRATRRTSARPACSPADLLTRLNARCAFLSIIRAQVYSPSTATRARRRPSTPPWCGRGRDCIKERYSFYVPTVLTGQAFAGPDTYSHCRPDRTYVRPPTPVSFDWRCVCPALAGTSS